MTTSGRWVSKRSSTSEAGGRSNSAIWGTQMWVQPWARGRSTRWGEPRKPAPPVTTNTFVGEVHRVNDSVAGRKCLSNSGVGGFGAKGGDAAGELAVDIGAIGIHHQADELGESHGRLPVKNAVGTRGIGKEV